MLSFVDAIKQIIANIQSTGGAVIERTFPSHQLLQQVREYAFQCLAEAPSAPYLLEWFYGGYFEEHVRACVVHLHKLGISDDTRVSDLLTKVIDIMTKGRAARQEGFEDQLVRSLEIVWDEMGDEQTYLYMAAEDRWLITWDYQKPQWKATSLGRIFLELSPFQAAIFLLSIDTLFATGDYDFHHISSNLLRRLQSEQPDKEELLGCGLAEYPLNLLMRLGIFSSANPAAEPESLATQKQANMTLMGQAVLRAVLSPDNPFRDTALAIIRTEEVGGTFGESAAEINEILDLVNQTDLVDRDNRDSIQNSAWHFHAQKYLDSLKLLYPSIEAILGMMLIRVGEIPESFKGPAVKARELGQRGIIPLDVSQAMEVFAARNKILHGNFSAPKDYVFPLCLLAFRYLRRLLTEYHLESAL